MNQKQFREKVVKLESKYRSLESKMMNNDKWDMVDEVNQAGSEYIKFYHEYKKTFNKKINFGG
jgi:hypothetical protein